MHTASGVRKQHRKHRGLILNGQGKRPGLKANEFVLGLVGESAFWKNEQGDTSVEMLFHAAYTAGPGLRTATVYGYYRELVEFAI